MTVTIDFAPDDEQKLMSRAASRGEDVAAYVRRLVRQDLDLAPGAAARPHPNQASLELLARWAEEDETDDPAELERRRLGWETFRQSMNENSLSNRTVYP